MNPGGDTPGQGYDETDPAELARRTLAQRDAIQARIDSGELDEREGRSLIVQVMTTPILLDRFPGPPEKVTAEAERVCSGCGASIPAGTEHLLFTNPLALGPGYITFFCRMKCMAIPPAPPEEGEETDT